MAQHGDDGDPEIEAEIAAERAAAERALDFDAERLFNARDLAADQPVGRGRVAFALETPANDNVFRQWIIRRDEELRQQDEARRQEALRQDGAGAWDQLTRTTMPAWRQTFTIGQPAGTVTIDGITEAAEAMRNGFGRMEPAPMPPPTEPPPRPTTLNQMARAFDDVPLFDELLEAWDGIVNEEEDDN